MKMRVIGPTYINFITLHEDSIGQISTDKVFILGFEVWVWTHRYGIKMVKTSFFTEMFFSFLNYANLIDISNNEKNENGKK